jgi:PAS domain S-box-containing protein
MVKRSQMIYAGVLCLICVWGLLFAGFIMDQDWAGQVPAGAIILLLVLAAILTMGSGRTRRTRWGLFVAILLTMASLLSAKISERNTAGLESSWWRSESRHLAATLYAAGEEISRLESVSKSVGDRVSRFLVSGGFENDGASRYSRYEIFSKIDSLATAVSEDGTLSAETVIGIQLFDRNGERFAWAGWPHAVSLKDRVYMEGGVELVYSREVSLYRVLTRLIPVPDNNNTPAFTIVVDMPLEVNYRVNNRFLKSAGLADNIRSDEVANISFEYSPALTNLPYRLERYKIVQEQNYLRRQRMIAARERRESDGQAKPRDEEEQPPTGRRRFGQEDSVLTYFPFPAHIEPTSEINGDKATGLQGRVLIRSPHGNPVVSVTANGFPFRHYIDLYQSRWLSRAKALIVLTLLVLFVVAMLALDRHGHHAWLRGVAFVGFLVLFRYSLLSFRPFSAGQGQLLFDPTVFATPILGGIMRSAGDLLITGIVFVIMLYGLMKMIRTQGSLKKNARPAADTSGREPAPWEFAAKGAAIAVVLLGVYRLARLFVGAVVINANPRLVGETMQLTDASVLVLHLGVFLTVTGILMTGLLIIWGAFRLTSWNDATRAAWVAFVLLVLVAVVWGPRELVPIAAVLLLFVVLAPRYVQREDLVSIAVVSFCLVIITSGMSYLFLDRNYDSLRKNFIREKAEEQVVPSDNWKVMILEDVLDEYSRMPQIRNAFRNPRSLDAQRLAFDLWADGPLSLLGYSCAIHVVTSEDSVISGFAVDMPYRVRIPQGGERIDTPIENDWVVLDLTRSTPQGIVRYYRGIVNVENEHGYVSGSQIGGLVGKVVVDLPFFFGSLEWAARTGPRTPELLRNVQEGGVSPRVEEPEALLLARLDGTRIYESSSEGLPAGFTVGEEHLRAGLDENWPLLNTDAGGFRILVRETGEPDKYLLAGFAVPSPARHLLRWSAIFSLYMLFTAVLIVATLMLSSIPYIKELLPTLTPGRKLGFQQKLLASFLVVALVPAVILGLFSVDFIKDRFVQENRQEALDKLFSARKALVNLLQGEMQLFLAQGEKSRLFTDPSYVNDAAMHTRLVKVFDETGRSGALVLDDRGRPTAKPDSIPAGLTADLTDASTEDLYVVFENGTWYVGVLSPPMVVSGDDWSLTNYLYYSRRLDSELLGDIADQVSADVNVFHDGGSLIASSQEGLLAGGLISAIIDCNAYVKVSLLGSNHSLATERTGSYSYQVAYLPVTSWSPVSAGGPGRAAMSVPLVFLPESYSVEIQKATSVVLGIFALLFMATIGLGLLLARGIFEPLRSLLEGTRRIISGDLNVRLPMRRSDEIGIVVSAFNEMTAQLSQSQRALNERRRYLETILTNIGTGVVSTDADNRIQTVNSAAERILGVESRQVVGRTAETMVDTPQGSEIFRILRDARDADHAFVASEVELQQDGRRSTVKYMLTRLEVEDRYLGMVFVFEDLTELIQTKKLSAWVEMARQIAHEIKNPLTPIRISTQFMQRAYEQKSDKFDQIFREGSETIIQQVDVLKRIASEFSSYGRMQQLDMGTHDLSPMLGDIIRLYLDNSSGVTVEMHNSCPDAIVQADPEAVRKICTNLIENAMDAMPGGGRLDVSCRREGAGGIDYIRTSFRDTGPGLSSEAAKSLFEPYFSTKTTGTGLGLAICRSLSQEMGGDIEVVNVPGGGVEASILLRVQA